MSALVYPSIPGPSFAALGEPCVAFEKLDGSNLRFFWNQRRGWHSTGTRYRWFKPETPTFGPAVALFQRDFAPAILATLRQHKEYRGVTELVAFCEYFGPGTFSGLHVEGEALQLVLFDLHLGGRGFVAPKDFVTHFGHLRIPRVVYEGPFSRTFIEEVRHGKYPVTEGVVAKGVRTRRVRKGTAEKEVWMAKVKTLTWLEELGRRSGDLHDLQAEYEQILQEQQLPPETTELSEPAEEN
jgi:hypothetical protein